MRPCYPLNCLFSSPIGSKLFVDQLTSHEAVPRIQGGLPVTVFHIFDWGVDGDVSVMTGTRLCSLYIQSLPTASEFSRGTESFDEIRRDSIPFRMRDVYTANRFCKVESCRRYHSSTAWVWSQPYTMASNRQFGARFQVEKKSHKMQLCGIGPPSPREYASLSL